MARIPFRHLVWVVFGSLIAASAGLARAESPQPLVIYCSADEAFARPILAEFSRQTSIEVRPLFDTEAGKTTGLVHRLLSERARPRADVWWSSEIFGTMQLAEAGLLAEYEPATVRDIPAAFRDAGRRWTAFGLRGRVIVYRPDKTPREKLPRAWADLARPEFKGRVAIANPIYGTTRGHMATQHALWGEAALQKWLTALRDNGVRVTDGNSQSVLLVARGEVELAATDTDDVIVAQARGDKVEMCFPDLDSPDGRTIPGTLWIPNSVALVRGGPGGDAAKRLADYLASAEVERKLAESESANLPVRRAEGKAGANDNAVRRFGTEFGRGSFTDYGRAAALLRRTDAMVRETLLR